MEEKKFITNKKYITGARGNSGYKFQCPFCQAELFGRLQNLNGKGLRCTCGALVKKDEYKTFSAMKKEE